MTFDELQRKGLIEPAPAARGEVGDLLRVVDRDAGIAQELVSMDLDCAFALAYNSMLQACHALMRAHGFVSRGSDRHKTAIAFARAALPPGRAPGLEELDRVRRKRHKVVYQMAGIVGHNEAVATIELAQRLAQVVRDEIRRLIGGLPEESG